MALNKKLLLRIGGDEAVFNLEHRIFNVSCFMITVFGILGGFGNYFSGLHLMTVWLSVAGVFVSGFLFYWARIKEVFNTRIIFVYLSATVFVLGFMFFYNGGAQGTILYLIIMLLTIFLLIVPRRYQSFFGIILYATLLLLIVLEFLFPEWIIPYNSTNEMLLDHVLTMFYSVFFTTIIIVLFRRKHLEDRHKILLQNESLLLLNQQIISQKNELEVKTIQLQSAIENAQERNKYIETLLQELNHRVKNNLQLVSSLLQKQANLSNDHSAKVALLDTKNRLLSLILLHQRLYGHENTTRIFVPKYLKELAESILSSYNEFGEENIIYDTDDVWLDVEVAISIGLVANELITNCFKHAFKLVPEPKLYLSFKKHQTDFVLTVTDNGVGMKETREGSSFGIELIELLTKQLKGKLVKESSENKGCSIILTFSSSRVS
jgi:two-component sensor histidine kinase